MKISVIVPVYNAEKYIRKLIDSVVNQTYKDYELILVDDGSTDDSLAIMKKKAEKNKKIKVLYKKNGGPGFARKLGFEKCAGDLLFFVDSDDWVTNNNVFQKITDIMKDEKIDILFFDRVDQIGNDDNNIIEGFENMTSGYHDIKDISNYIVRPGLGTKVFRRCLFDESMFIETKVYEDLYSTFLYLDKCKSFYYLNESLYTIYHDYNSMTLSSMNNSNSFGDMLELIISLYNSIDSECLKYSLSLRMPSLFLQYCRYILDRNYIYNSNKSIERNIEKIILVIKKQNISICHTKHYNFKKIVFSTLIRTRMLVMKNEN